MDGELIQRILDEAKTCNLPRDGIFALDGMSGLRYRHFINRLTAALGDVRYLEVGSWKGSTLCSVLAGNKVAAAAIDNWSEFGGPRGAFRRNVETYQGESAVWILEGDYQVVFRTMPMGDFNVYMFDGPHTLQDQHDGIVMALPYLAEEFLLIVDDWNFPQVKAGTSAAFTNNRLTLVHSHEIHTDSNPGFAPSDWHNGYLIAVVRK